MNLFLKMVLMVPSVMFGAASAAESFSFSSKSVSVTAEGVPKTAQAVEIPVAGGTVISNRAVFPVWADGKGEPPSTVRLKGGTVLLLEDGTELSFDAGELDVAASRIKLDGGLRLSASNAALGKTAQPVEYTCNLGRMYANGESTGFSSVCLVGARTRLWCIGNTLRVQTWSPACSEP